MGGALLDLLGLLALASSAVLTVSVLLFLVFLFFRDFQRFRERRRAARAGHTGAPARVVAPRPAPRPAPRIAPPQPRPAPQGRCPFCHEDVDARACVVCALCLARHHDDCWDEGGACAACRGTERYGRLEAPRDRVQGT